MFKYSVNSSKLKQIEKKMNLAMYQVEVITTKKTIILMGLKTKYFDCISSNSLIVGHNITSNILKISRYINIVRSQVFQHFRKYKTK